MYEANAAGALSGRAQTGISTAPPQPFSGAANALESACALAHRVNVLADRLLGPRVENEKSRGPSLQPSGVLPALEESARETTFALQSAFDSLARIESALP